MGTIDTAMVHTCSILRESTTTQASSGEPSTSYSTTASVCLFENVSTSGNYISNSEAGPVILYSILCSLPDTVTIQEGDYISTTETNWAGTYRVEHVDAPEIPFTDVVDHKEAFLKRVAKRGG